MGNTGCCQHGRFAFITTRLGRCPNCMRRAGAGAAIAWVVVSVLLAVSAPSWTTTLAVALAAGVSLLFAGHLVVYVVAATRALSRRTARGQDPTVPLPDSGQRLNRRRLLSRALRVGWVAAFAALAGYKLTTTSSAKRGDGLIEARKKPDADASPDPSLCDGTHTTNIGLGLKRTCVNNNVNKPEQVAQNKIQHEFAKPAIAAAETFCGTFNDCDTPNECFRVPGQGKLEYNVTCTRALNQGPPDACKNNEVKYNCDGTLTKVTCVCQRSRP